MSQWLMDWASMINLSLLLLHKHKTPSLLPGMIFGNILSNILDSRSLVSHWLIQCQKSLLIIRHCSCHTDLVSYLSSSYFFKHLNFFQEFYHICYFGNGLLHKVWLLWLVKTWLFRVINTTKLGILVLIKILLFDLGYN